MEDGFKYKLDPGPKKFPCPACGKKSFVLYKDREGNYLPDYFGRCDREHKCGHHRDPYSDGYGIEKEKRFQGRRNIPRTKSPWVKVKEPKEPIFIPEEELRRTEGAKGNVFLRNLVKNVPHPFPIEEVEQIKSLYRIGTIDRGDLKGATAFPFIDGSGNIRFVQVKSFDNSNHTTGTNALHSILKKDRSPVPQWLQQYEKQDNKISCLFGEHLIPKFPSNPVSIVEAPKTAIYATLHFGNPSDSPETPIWLAVGALSWLNVERCRALVGRKVRFFPDEGAFEEWKEKLEEIRKEVPFEASISSLMEGKESGSDLADILETLDWREFRMNRGGEEEKINSTPLHELHFLREKKETSEEQETKNAEFVQEMQDPFEAIVNRPEEAPF